MPIMQPAQGAVTQALQSRLPQWMQHAGSAVQEASPDWLKRMASGLANDPSVLAQTSLPTGLGGIAAQEGWPAVTALAHKMFGEGTTELPAAATKMATERIAPLARDGFKGEIVGRSNLLAQMNDALLDVKETMSKPDFKLLYDRTYQQVMRNFVKNTK